MKLTLTTLGIVTLAALATPVAGQMPYPDKCKSAANSLAMGHDMPMEDMTDYQKVAMDGMKSMNMNMTQGMMKKDADVSFVCGMIAHHLGAISMSEVELKYGDNTEAKAKAQKIIDDQTREVEELTEWVDKEVK